MSYSILKSLNKKVLPSAYFFAPEWIVLGVNNVCNLHCKMCDVGTKTTETNFAQNLVGTHPINMPLELIMKIIDDLHEYYPSTKLGYAFTEPLVYPFLGPSLLYAKEKNVETAITTNALTLVQKAELIAEAGVENLFISLDGPESIHNEIRGHPKSFQKAIAGIEKILSLNPAQKISIFCVITEWNIGYLKEFADYFKIFPIKELGFMHTNFTPQSIADYHNTIWNSKYPATASNVEEVNIDNFDINFLWEEINEIKQGTYSFPIIFSPEIESWDKLRSFYHEPKKMIGKMCNDVFSNIMIKSDGSVIPSHGRCYNINLGNVYTQSIKEIWNANPLKRFRSDLIKNGGLLPACSRCCSAF